jgi:hypothetical protein
MYYVVGLQLLLCIRVSEMRVQKVRVKVTEPSQQGANTSTAKLQMKCYRSPAQQGPSILYKSDIQIDPIGAARPNTQ